MRLVLALLFAAALGSAPSALAQTSDYRAYWPLTPGNAWVYVNSSTSGSSAGSTTTVGGSTVWTALDSVTVAAGRLPRVRIEQGASAPVECLVSFEAFGPETPGGIFRLLDATGEEFCNVANPMTWDDPAGVSPGFSLYASSVTTEPVVIGGESYGSRRTSLGFADAGGGGINNAWSWKAADSLGLLTYAHQTTALGGYHSVQTMDLRWAQVDGQTYGQPLASRPEFLPLGAGNRWEYNLMQNGTSRGAVAWTVVPDGDGAALRLDHVENGEVASTVTCPVAVEDASAATGWRTRFRFDCVLPAVMLAPRYNGGPGVWVDTFVADTTVAIGPQTVSTDLAVTSTWAAARDIGVTRFVIIQSSGQWDATLGYARVDGMTYGQQVIATDGAPSSARLHLSAGPNPTAGALAVRFSLPVASEARLVAIDALGRDVRSLDLGDRPAGAGTATLATDGLAPGVYTLRLTAGEAAPTVRISVVR